MIRTYRDLRVYQQSYELGKEIHHVTQHFPKHEQYEMGTLDYACEFSYISEETHQKLWDEYEQLGKQISLFHEKWQ